MEIWLFSEKEISHNVTGVTYSGDIEPYSNINKEENKCLGDNAPEYIQRRSYFRKGSGGVNSQVTFTMNADYDVSSVFMY